ncbi:Transcriptional regulatory protein, C terminal [Streptomyces mirabilis]|uniref:Transcriptional regulatory protein, C terminal n=1 Tax=Streptomyces mirabilis TaxID=68239 RepID=A0A1I2KK63_9ACTN|nr:Transcriptional regulatory protein, C terminal [Streptomyces mirabilis]
MLARNVGAAVSRETLMAEVWDENRFGSTKTLDVTMAGLRRRLADTASRPSRTPRITTLRGTVTGLNHPEVPRHSASAGSGAAPESRRDLAADSEDLAAGQYGQCQQPGDQGQPHRQQPVAENHRRRRAARDSGQREGHGERRVQGTDPTGRG